MAVERNVLRREGEVWLVGSAADGRFVRLRDGVGLRLLARLVGEPGRECHVLDLSPHSGGPDTPVDGIDQSAKKAYRQRVAELRAEIDEAEDFNDDERAERARAELAAVTTEIARAVGLHGQDRKTGTAAERARVRVTRALRVAVDRITGELPALGAHLRYAVRTGTYCSYEPDLSASPPGWVVDVDVIDAETSLDSEAAGSSAAMPVGGIFAFLFTDVEDSTPMWEGHPAEMALALARHDEILRAAVAAHGGRVFSIAGDGFAVAFATPTAALSAALDAQRALGVEPWPEGAAVRVRMGVHVGAAKEREASFFGADVSRAARVAAAAHGGQVVVTEATADLVRDHLGPDVSLVPLGEYRLKGLTRPERVFQVTAPGLDPSLKSLRPPAGREGNLPASVTAFIGRAAELQELTGEVPKRRLITLVGPGGAGKTRLAIETAWQLADEFRDGVWLCELAPVSAPQDVAFAVGDVLRVRPQQGLNMLESIVESLRGRHVLLVVDNCEHVVDATAELVARVVQRCPTVAVLATSREPLGVQGERVWPLGGLEMAIDAPALFRDRAEAADARHPLDSDDSASVAVICARLDGLPLAIELAAARARSLALADIAARLDDRFRLLRGGGRDRPGRHQTLLAAIDWSYQLLSDNERWLFDRLSIFPGTFDAEAAAEVCGHGPVDPMDVADLLHQLVDKSVLVADRSAPTTRFFQLETLRQFGAPHLDSAEADRLKDRLVSHFLLLARRARALFVTSDAAGGRALFRTDWHNIRAAVQFALARADTDSVSQLLDAVFWHAESAGLLEVGSWAETALALPRPTSFLFGVAGFFASMRDNDEARRLAEAGLAAAATADDPGARICWQTMQLVHWYGGRPVDAFAAQQRVIALAHPDHDADRYAAAYAHAVAGGTASWAGRPDGVAHLREAARLAAPLGNPTLHMWLTFMAASHAWGENRFPDAFTGFQAAANEAAEAECPSWEFRALGTLVGLAGLVGRDDSDRICHDVLARLYAARTWSDIWSVLEQTFVHWVTAGRTLDAGVLLGYLEANDLHHTLNAAERSPAAKAVRDDPDGRASLAVGATFNRDQVVAYVLDRLAAAGQ